MASEKISAIVDEVAALSVIELAELVKEVEERFGVSAAAAVVAAAPAASETAEVEEKTEFDVVLESFEPSAKIKVIKAVRELTTLGLGDAKATVEAAPKAIKEGVSKEEAEAAKTKLEEAGGKVTLK